jgi:hypothetical protein
VLAPTRCAAGWQRPPAPTRVETAVFDPQDLAELIRQRPDIGQHIYRNLAVGMGEKLKRLNESLCDRPAPPGLLDLGELPRGSG